MKRLLALGALLVVLPLATAAGCPKEKSGPTAPEPASSDFCVLTANGCNSPAPRT